MPRLDIRLAYEAALESSMPLIGGLIAGVAVGLVVDPVSGALMSASEKAIARIIGTPGAAAFVGKMYRASFESS